jgi:hypothetical protein
MRLLLTAVLAFSFWSRPALAAAPDTFEDTDRDGLSDTLENALLSQFAPHFMVSEDDCALLPAQFVPLLEQPQVEKVNGAIYGQATPRAVTPGQVELHYYHLWRQDCGEMSHSLDAEHVSALLVRDDTSQWKAIYWYAAAHEDTLCDASQVARAVAVDGERHGPLVWVSRGKHASFLNASICTHGCGGDRCSSMRALAIPGIINLGEPSNAMNGATWTVSPEWPLAVKMTRSDFADARIARAEADPVARIVWANPRKRPIQAGILGGNDAVAGASTGLQAADTALDAASSHGGNALGTASGNTGNALAKSAGGVKRALRATAHKLGLAP